MFHFPSLFLLSFFLSFFFLNENKKQKNHTHTHTRTNTNPNFITHIVLQGHILLSCGWVYLLGWRSLWAAVFAFVLHQDHLQISGKGLIHFSFFFCYTFWYFFLVCWPRSFPCRGRQDFQSCQCCLPRSFLQFLGLNGKKLCMSCVKALRFISNLLHQTQKRMSKTDRELCRSLNKKNRPSAHQIRCGIA